MSPRGATKLFFKTYPSERTARGGRWERGFSLTYLPDVAIEAGETWEARSAERTDGVATAAARHSWTHGPAADARGWGVEVQRGARLPAQGGAIGCMARGGGEARGRQGSAAGLAKCLPGAPAPSRLSSPGTKFETRREEGKVWAEGRQAGRRGGRDGRPRPNGSRRPRVKKIRQVPAQQRRRGRVVEKEGRGRGKSHWLLGLQLPRSGLGGERGSCSLKNGPFLNSGWRRAGGGWGKAIRWVML